MAKNPKESDIPSSQGEKVIPLSPTELLNRIDPRFIAVLADGEAVPIADTDGGRIGYVVKSGRIEIRREFMSEGGYKTLVLGHAEKGAPFHAASYFRPMHRNFDRNKYVACGPTEVMVLNSSTIEELRAISKGSYPNILESWLGAQAISEERQYDAIEELMKKIPSKQAQAALAVAAFDRVAHNERLNRGLNELFNYIKQELLGEERKLSSTEIEKMRTLLGKAHSGWIDSELLQHHPLLGGAAVADILSSSIPPAPLTGTTKSVEAELEEVAEVSLREMELVAENAPIVPPRSIAVTTREGASRPRKEPSPPTVQEGRGKATATQLAELNNKRSLPPPRPVAPRPGPPPLTKRGPGVPPPLPKVTAPPRATGPTSLVPSTVLAQPMTKPVPFVPRIESEIEPSPTTLIGIAEANIAETKTGEPFLLAKHTPPEQRAISPGGYAIISDRSPTPSALRRLARVAESEPQAEEDDHPPTLRRTLDYAEVEALREAESIKNAPAVPRVATEKELDVGDESTKQEVAKTFGVPVLHADDDEHEPTEQRPMSTLGFESGKV